MGREKRRKSDLACENVCPEHVIYNAVGRENERISTERAEKSAQSMSNIMTWAEKITGEATARAKMSAKACQI